jgi:haloalkane dehalogenase
MIFKKTNKSISADFPFQSNFIDILDSNLHYVDEGKGTTFLFLHGNPTSSYLWRNIIPYISKDHRAIAVDLIGMGKSGKPDISYKMANHCEYIEEFIQKLELKNVVLVLHDWGSFIGLKYAMENEKNVKGVVLMEGILRPWESWETIPVVTRRMFKKFFDETEGSKVIYDENFFIEKAMPYLTKRKLSKIEMDHYRKPFEVKSSRKPMLIFPRELPIAGENPENATIIKNYNKWLSKTDVPIHILWAKPGSLFRKEFIPLMRKDFPKMTDFCVGKSKHYLQEDLPDEIGSAIIDWFTEQNE